MQLQVQSEFASISRARFSEVKRRRGMCAELSLSGEVDGRDGVNSKKRIVELLELWVPTRAVDGHLWEKQI